MAAPKKLAPSAPKNQALIDAERTVKAAKRMLKIHQARVDLIEFTLLTMPHPEDPDDPDLSRYEPQYFHRALAAALQEVEAGRLARLIITFPPRHGKSELSSRRFPAWYVGRDPYRHLILATYNDTFAEDFGRNVRDIIKSPYFAQAFPKCSLKPGSAAASRLETQEGGLMSFVGTGGSLTGRGADVLIIDDPIKDRLTADSKLMRDGLWDWFNEVASTRLMSDTGSIIIIQTRWHEDDLVGRLTDPTNPCYSEEEARQWKVINIPAIAEENDVLGRPEGAALWPERFGIDYLTSFRNRNPRGFSALYQQRPTPEDGEFFRKDQILTYTPDQLPKRLRMYAASDHAVGQKQENDFSCLGCVGVDEDDDIWIMPDLHWERSKTDKTVDAMLSQMKKYKPIFWWAASDHISKSIGPFLRKRMQEEKTYINVVESSEKGDKMAKAQAIQARMSMGKVHFPRNAPWLQRAIAEMLKFPSARHDDFVDFLSHIGRGLSLQVPAHGHKKPADISPPVGTFSWIKHNAKFWSRRDGAAASLRDR